MSIFSSRPLLLLAAFLVGVLAVDAVLGAGLTRVVGMSKFRYTQVFTGQVSEDVVILGNSRAVHALYAPELREQTCRPVRNLAYNGMPIEAQEMVLEGLLRGGTPPQTVILEISTLLSPLENVQQLSTFETLDPALGTALDPYRAGVVPWHKALRTLAFNNELFYRSLFYLGSGDQRWINRRSPISAKSVEAVLEAPPRTFTVRPEARDVLLRMAQTAQAAGIEMIFFVAPYHDVLLQTAPDAVTWGPKSIGADLPLLNFTQSLSGDEAFADPLHTNIIGARQIADALLKDVPSLSRCSATHIQFNLMGRHQS